jgi:hypothetical protein
MWQEHFVVSTEKRHRTRRRSNSRQAIALTLVIPIIARYNIAMYDNYSVFAICDGCGWGTPAKDAAQKARFNKWTCQLTGVSDVFVEYMKSFKTEIGNTGQAVRLMLRAFSAAHSAVCENTMG